MKKMPNLNEDKSQSVDTKFILESIGIGIWTYYPQTQSLSWDSSMYALFEIAEEDFSGHYDAWEKSLHPDDLEAATSNLRDTLLSGKDFNAQFRIITKNGKEKYIKAKALTTYDDESRPVKMSGINWDITNEVVVQNLLNEQKSLYERRAKLASLGELVAGLGHEINNPLAIITGYLAMLKKRVRASGETIDTATVTEYLEKMSTVLDRITKTVKSLKAFSPSDPKQEKRFGLDDLLRETIDMVSKMYANDGVTLRVLNSTIGKDIYLFANFERLQSVLLHLLSNAKDAVANSKQKMIEISVRRKFNKVVISIMDTGAGIDQDKQKRVFEPYFSTKDVNKGTGISLSLSHAIIKEHYGSLTFKSTPKLGSTFTIELPAIFESTPSPEKRKREGDEEKFKELKFQALVVDDEPSLLEVLSELMTEMGFEVKILTRAEDALIYLDENKGKIDLVICDMKMPGLSGIDLFKKLRSERKKYENTKLVLMTGEMNIEAEELVKVQNICDGCIYKPFREEELLDMFSQLFMSKS